MSTWPDFKPSTVRACVSSSTNRDSISTTTGKFLSRSRKTWKCCCASTVVGASNATCLPLIAALKAARSAHRVDLEQLLCHVLDDLACAPTRARPVGSAEAVQRRCAFAAEVLLHAVEVFDRDEKAIAFRVLELEVFAVGAVP